MVNSLRGSGGTLANIKTSGGAQSGASSTENPPVYRETEGDDVRITESGKERILE